MNMLCMVVMLAAQLEFSFSSFWLTSTENTLTDAASCFAYSHLFTIAPLMHHKPCLPHPPLCGIKHMLTSCPAPPSSCGMAWPQPAQHTGLVRSPSLTSCSSTPISATWMNPFSQQHKHTA